MRFLLSAFVLASGPWGQCAYAQLAITKVNVGFQASGTGERSRGLWHFKAGAWAPVFVDIEARSAAAGGKVVIETTDSADVLNRYTTPMPRLAQGERATVVAYALPGSLGAAIRVTAVDADGAKSTYVGDKDYEALDSTRRIYLVVGTRSPDVDEAATRLEPDGSKERNRLATYIDDIKHLPDRWFGYDGVDLLIFTTGNRAFLRNLLDDTTGRKEALGRWAHRGGRIVLSIEPGNAALVASLLKGWGPPLAPVLTGTARTLASPGRLGPLVQFAEAYGKPFETAGSAPLQAADFAVSGPAIGPVEVLVSEAGNKPLLVRVPYGLGSATLLGIDLGTAPFIRWEGRERFWQKLLTRFGPARAQRETSRSATVNAEEQNDLATTLQREMEVFPGAEPVSFGLVAVLMFLFIMLVGPLDYLFVTKVLKRMEWSWITYPTIIIAVSAAAFVGVQGLTVKDLLVNKVDLLDIDQERSESRVVGTTWVTSFSSKAENATLQIEPASPEWAPSGAGPAVLSVLGRPEDSGLTSTGRRQAQTIFQRGYEYGPDATAVVGIPIPHRGTRAFKGTWEAGRSRPFETRLTYDPSNPERLLGSIVSHLPVEVQEAAVFFEGKWCGFDEPIKPGQLVSLTGRSFQGQEEWIGESDKRNAHGDNVNLGRTIETILFHDKMSHRGTMRNNVLGSLDQSWRLRERSSRTARTREAILVGRLPPMHGRTEQVNGAAGSPTRLRLHRGGKHGVELRATVNQATFIRVYLAIEPGRANAGAD